MTALNQLSDQIQYMPNGIWHVPQTASVHYPESDLGNSALFDKDSFWFQHRRDAVLLLMKKFHQYGPIIDIGGGAGYMTLSIQEAGFDAVLVEPGLEGVLAARKRGVHQIIHATFQDVQFKPASLTSVGLFDVIEHFSDDEALLKDVFHAMTPGGYVYATVPAFSFLWSKEDEYVHHFRRYNLREITRVFNAAGFEILYSTYLFTFLVAPIFFLRSIPSFFNLRTKNVEKRDERKKDHVIQKGIFSLLLQWLRSFELSRIQRLRQIALGSTCLIVARIPSRRQP